MDIYTAAGLAGFGLYVAAYGLVQLGKLDGNGLTYSVLNIVAAALVLVGLIRDFNLASALIQVSWISFGLIGIIVRWSVPRPATVPSREQTTRRLR